MVWGGREWPVDTQGKLFATDCQFNSTGSSCQGESLSRCLQHSAHSPTLVLVTVGHKSDSCHKPLDQDV